MIKAKYIKNPDLEKVLEETGQASQDDIDKVFDNMKGHIYNVYKSEFNGEYIILGGVTEEGEKEYEESITISVRLGKIEGGIMLPDQAVRPWEYDPNYSKYRDKYNTVPYQISFQKSEGKIVLDSIDVKVCNAQNLFYSIKDTLVANGEGFKIDSSDGEKDGWIIWLTEENDSINTFLVFKKKIEFKPNDNVYEVEQPNTMKRILAGIYVVPSYEAIGIVSFNLCGILVEQNEKWDLARISILPNETSNPSKVKVRTPVVQEDRDTELTLIESNKKKDKNKKDRK